MSTQHTLDPDEPTPREYKRKLMTIQSAVFEVREFVSKIRVGVTVEERDKMLMLALLDKALSPFGARPALAAQKPDRPAPAEMLMALAHIRWTSFGECRKPGWEAAPPTAAETVAVLESALAASQAETLVRARKKRKDK